MSFAIEQDTKAIAAAMEKYRGTFEVCKIELYLTGNGYDPTLCTYKQSIKNHGILYTFNVAVKFVTDVEGAMSYMSKIKALVDNNSIVVFGCILRGVVTKERVKIDDGCVDEIRIWPGEFGPNGKSILRGCYWMCF